MPLKPRWRARQPVRQRPAGRRRLRVFAARHRWGVSLRLGVTRPPAGAMPGRHSHRLPAASPRRRHRPFRSAPPAPTLAADLTRGWWTAWEEQSSDGAPLDHPLGAARAQVHDTYIVAQTQDGLVVVDQHAAHERIVYERLKEAIAKNGAPRQILLIPEIVELDETDVER